MLRAVSSMSRLAPLALIAAALGFVAVLGGGGRSSAETAHAVPAPMTDETPGQADSEVAVFAGGCFWGVQGVFQHVEGVTRAVSGYTGGAADTAHYRVVGEGTTGHAESVQVTFDPHKVSYGTLLRIFFSVAHDPTTLNRQGPDYGTQYRSGLFPLTAEQARVAEAYIHQMDQAHVFGAPIVTKIEPGRTFYPAEDYHQDYLTLHPDQPYIAINDLPKVEALKTMFPTAWRAAPVLVSPPR